MMLWVAGYQRVVQYSDKFMHAWHCIALSLHDNTVQKLNNKEGSKTMRHFKKPCINLSEYWTLSLERAGKGIKLNETNSYPNIQQIPKKKTGN